MKCDCSEDGTCMFHGKEAPCEMDRIVALLGIPVPLAERSADVCSAVVKGRLLRRQPLSLIAASSVYVACRESRTPITIRELALESDLDPTEVGRCYRLIGERLRLSVPTLGGTSYASKVAARVGASAVAANISTEVVRRAVAKGFGDRNPMTLAAAAVYTACLARGEAVTQSDVAEAAGVSVVSVRECARQMLLLVNGLAQSRGASRVHGDSRLVG